MIELVRASQAEEDCFLRLLQHYLYEMTAYYPQLPEEDGMLPSPFPPIEFGGGEDGAAPYFLRENGMNAGLALLSRASYLGEEADHVLCGFTVFPSSRRRKLGSAFGKMILESRPGRWEIKYNERNRPAAHLWTRLAEPYAPRSVRVGEQETVLAFRV